jgi:lipoprotein-anchoring transpeptidase ErfK/SrfK
MATPAPYGKPQPPFRYYLIAFLSTLVILIAFLFFGQILQPAAFLLNGIEHGPAWAQAVIAKPVLVNPNIPGDGNPDPILENETPLSMLTATPSVTPTLLDTPLQSSPTPNPPTITEVIAATAELAAEASPTPLPTDTDVPVEKPGLPTNAAGSGRWIDVDLSKQMVYAYEGDTLVNSFLVSTGVAQTPTVTGQYRIYVKYHHKDMSGPGYYLPDVPFIMYFFEGYGFHGTYWHNNFGTPMSRGCVNLSIPDAEWLYNFASVGTLANIHY